MDWPAISVAIAGLTLLILITGRVFLIGNKVGQIETRIGQVETRIVGSEALTAGALAKHDILRGEMAEHEKADAAAFAKLETLVITSQAANTATEMRISKAFEDLNRRFDQVTDRLDRVLEGRR